MPYTLVNLLIVPFDILLMFLFIVFDMIFLSLLESLAIFLKAKRGVFLHLAHTTLIIYLDSLLILSKILDFPSSSLGFLRLDAFLQPHVKKKSQPSQYYDHVTTHNFTA